ncbi:MAG TPA: amidase [Anaerolineales bacterium]|nr:amidase [Anaerolineales bacterium]
MEELLEKIESLEARFDSFEPEIQAYLPELGRFDRLRAEAVRLAKRFPGPAGRPPLYGLLAGIKDIFHVEGFETRAGSRLPAEALAGPEAVAVTRLRSAGALITGKTVTTEFAYFAPGPTRNPHNHDHTPGGSSSGSAAAAAAGLCDFALGTQTIGSINRPAAFCGVYGFKPSYDRIPKEGVIPLAPSFDHVGVLAGDLRVAEIAAAVLCDEWRPTERSGAIRLGVPTGSYLEHADPIARRHFEEVRSILENRALFVSNVALFSDFRRVRERHQKVLAFETARVHEEWYDSFSDRYHPTTAGLIQQGRQIGEAEYVGLLEDLQRYRFELDAVMTENEIDAWIAPAAPGSAPRGLGATGDPVMNLPWTQAGLPTITIPTGADPDGLPLGTQLAGVRSGDENLFRLAESVIAYLRV